MNLTSVEKIENGWKIQYESKATDGIPVTIKYPSFNDIGLGNPTRDFLQAVAPFLRFAIAISHLDKEYWMQYGSVTAIKLKEGKDDQMIQIKVQTGDRVFPTKITTDWVGFSRLMADLQATDPDAPFLSASMDDLEDQVEKYVNGDRAVEQLELPMPDMDSAESEKVPIVITAIA